MRVARDCRTISAAPIFDAAKIRAQEIRTHRTMRTLLLIPLAAMFVAGCDSSSQPPASAAAATAPPFHNVANVKQVMNWIIEPNADVLWDSVGTIITEQGREE